MTRLMVLGLLKMKPLSGYEIQQILQKSQTDKWAGILPGSIYHALKKMDTEELVAVEKVEQTGHRSKAIYKITNAGEQEFKKLLKESFEISSVVLPTTLYTAIGFIKDLPKEEIIESIEKQINHLEKDLDQMKIGEKIKGQVMTLDAITKLSFENIYKQYELQISFLHQVIVELTNNKS